MKHKIIALAAVAAAICMAAGFAACKPQGTEPEHEHSYGDWISGPETHWRECETCHEKFAEAKHSYRNVVGQNYTVYLNGSMPNPILRLSAEGSSNEVLVKEVWVCVQSETASLRVSYSASEGGTFASNAEIPAGSSGWTKAGFPAAGMLLSAASYFRLDAVGSDITVQEIVFLGCRTDAEEELFLLTPEIVGATGQEYNRQKGLIDAQQFPNEKRECYLCHYPEPKTQE